MSTLNITKLEPEIALLVSCARAYLHVDDQNQVRQSVGNVDLDWGNVFKLAHFHRMLPLLHKVLLSIPSEALPDYVLPKLYGYQLRNIKHNFSLLKELTKFLDILDAHHIKAITFKGPMTAISAYGDLSLRSFSDLDVLVHPDVFFKLRSIAKTHGYKSDLLMAVTERKCLEKLSPQEQESYFRSQKEYSLVNPENRTFIDVHQGFLSKRFSALFDTQWVWEYTQIVEIGGHQVLGLTPEIQILVSCVQGVEDPWHQLGKLFDVAILINRHPNLDWQELVAIAKKIDALPSLLLCLCLIRDLYGISLPDIVQEPLKSFSHIQDLVSQAKVRLISKDNLRSESKLNAASAVYQLRLLSSWKNRVRFGLRLLEPTLADRAAMPLPKPLFFIYYLLRPFRLMQEPL